MTATATAFDKAQQEATNEFEEHRKAGRLVPEWLAELVGYGAIPWTTLAEWDTKMADFYRLIQEAGFEFEMDLPAGAFLPISNGGYYRTTAPVTVRTSKPEWVLEGVVPADEARPDWQPHHVIRLVPRPDPRGLCRKASLVFVAADTVPPVKEAIQARDNARQHAAT